MEFDYIRKECDVGIIYIPTLPITINGFPVGHALIDTGADMTLLPMEVNMVLNLELDTDRPITIGSAGGGIFKAFPSKRKVTYSLEQGGHRDIVWEGTVYFSPRQPIILLGQHQCLSQLTLTLDAQNRKIRVQR